MYYDPFDLADLSRIESYLMAVMRYSNNELQDVMKALDKKDFTLVELYDKAVEMFGTRARLSNAEIIDRICSSMTSKESADGND